MTEKKTLTFIVYCRHDRKRYYRFLGSLAEQSNKHFNIILDDYNEQPSYVNGYMYGVKMVRRSPFRNDWGYGAALSLSHYAGDYVVFCNDDDVFFPETVQKILTAFENSPETDVVYYNMLHRRLNGAAPFITETKTGRIDKSAFAIRTTTFQELSGFDDVGQLGDGVFIEKAVMAGKAFVKITDVLLDKE
jgi:GT2 family glycosyltransferase